MARVSTTRYLTTAVAGGLALLLCAAYIFPAVPLWPNYGRSPAHGNTADNGIKSTDPMTDVARDAKMTRFLAHQPGFSVIENLYWHNYTYYFITDQPWSIPALNLVASLSVDSSRPAKGRVAAKIFAIRSAPYFPDVREENQLGTTISFEDAVEMMSSATVLDSPMLINNDDGFVAHCPFFFSALDALPACADPSSVYHWIGEMFLGAWRIWSNHAWRSGLALPPLRTVAFPSQWSEEEAPDDAKGADIWEDVPGANMWYTRKFFPEATIESRGIWRSRAASNKVYRIPMGILADRRGGHSGPSAASKPFGDSLRMPVSSDWFTNLRDRVLEGYDGPVSLHKGSLPRIMYLQRQDTSRRLTSEDHARLLVELEKIHNEGLAEVVIEHFGKEIGFADQVAKIATVDILVSVHGNGLTHTLWMEPGGVVFEFQPFECTITDYSPLAIAVGLQHYIVHEDSFCLPEHCPPRGCLTAGGINTDHIRLEPTVVTNEIRRILHNH